MAEAKSTTPVPAAPQKAEPTADKIAVPIEFASKNKNVRITKEKDLVTIELIPAIVAEVGAYHRVNVKIAFLDNGNVVVVPSMP